MVYTCFRKENLEGKTKKERVIFNHAWWIFQQRHSAWRSHTRLQVVQDLEPEETEVEIMDLLVFIFSDSEL